MIGRLAALAVIAVALTPASAQKVAGVDVSFEIAEWRYARALKPREISDIGAEAAAYLAAKCGERFRHIKFRADGSGEPEFKLSVVMDTEGRNASDRKPAPCVWYFTLTRSNPASPVDSRRSKVEWPVPYGSYEDAFKPIPNKDVVSGEILDFISPRTRGITPARRSEDLMQVLQHNVFSHMPLFSDRVPEIGHVPSTPLVTVPVTRTRLPDLPERAEFRLLLKTVPGDTFDFRARLLEEGALGKWDSQLGPLRSNVVAEIYSCSALDDVGSICNQSAVDDLTTKPQCKVVSALYLIGFLPPTPSEVDPGAYDPGP